MLCLALIFFLIHLVVLAILQCAALYVSTRHFPKSRAEFQIPRLMKLPLLTGLVSSCLLLLVQLKTSRHITGPAHRPPITPHTDAQSCPALRVVGENKE